LNKGKKALFLGLGGLLCAGAGLAWLIAPGRAKAEQRAVVQHRYFAHRGLYDSRAGIPENSLAAFRRAAEHGYGAELDVRMTRDGVLVIAHDANLKRMTGADAVVEETDYDDLASLRLEGTDEEVPLFADALDVLFSADVPVIVEIKSTPRARRDALCSAVLSELDSRDGLYCIESFDPMIVRWFRINAPDILRGQLTAQRWTLGSTPLLNFAASRVLYDFLGRPQFIAHREGNKAMTVRLAERMGALRVCWTVRDYGQEAQNDAIIFEGFLPPVRFDE
jgi:glycerophosphoryl diester phosphodiesterase